MRMQQITCISKVSRENLLLAWLYVFMIFIKSDINVHRKNPDGKFSTIFEIIKVNPNLTECKLPLSVTSNLLNKIQNTVRR